MGRTCVFSHESAGRGWFHRYREAGHRSKGAVGGEVRVMSEECIETLFRMVRQGMKQGVYSEIFVNIGC